MTKVDDLLEVLARWLLCQIFFSRKRAENVSGVITQFFHYCPYTDIIIAYRPFHSKYFKDITYVIGWALTETVTLKVIVKTAFNMDHGKYCFFSVMNLVHE